MHAASEELEGGELKAGMNSSRKFIGESASHEIKITPYWFVGPRKLDACKQAS